MNYERWKHLIDHGIPPDCMDWRHVQMIHSVLVNERPRSAVEIGCANGFSTSAIVEASEQGVLKWVDLIDPNVRPSLLKAIEGRKGFTVRPFSSQYYSCEPEFWLIDGDHQAGASIDYENAISAKAKIIVIHDSNTASSAGPQNWGAVQIAERLKKDAVVYFDDQETRTGEMTDRGLVIGFFYAPSPQTMIVLQDLSK